MTTVDVLNIIIRVKDAATAGLAKAQLGIRGVGRAAIGSKAALLGLGVGIAGIGAAAIILKKSASAAMELEQAMANVSSVTTATEEDLEKMKKAAIDMSTKTTVSAKEAADGMYFLASAGFDTKEIMDSLTPTIELAAGTQTDFSVAAGYAAKTLRAFGLDASEMGRVVDIMQGTIASSQNTIDSLGTSMSYVAPIASAAGMSLSETSAIIAVMANAGIEGSMAGTTLRRAILNLQTPSTELKEQMNALGISVYDSQGSMRNMFDILGDLEGATATMTEESRNYFMEQLFGTRAISGMNVVTKEGAVGLRDYANSLEDGVRTTNKLGAATEAMQKQQNTAKAQLKILKNMFTKVGISIGDAMAPAIGGSIKLLQRFGNWLSDNTGKIQSTVTGIGEVIRGVFERMSTPVGFAIDILKNFGNWFSDNKDKISGIVSSIGEAITRAMEAAKPTVALLGEKFKEIGDYLMAHDTEVKKIIHGIGTAFEVAFKAVEIVLEPVLFLLDRMWELIEWIGGSKIFKGISGFVGSAVEKFLEWEQPRPPEGYALGGTVPRDMIAQVHAGETIIPAGAPSSGGGGTSVIINVTTGDIRSTADVDYLINQIEEKIPVAIHSSPLER